MIISMGLVAPAFCAGKKTRTMRDWKPRQVKLVTECYEKGIDLSVWSSCPRVKGAERIGSMTLREPPFKQNIKEIGHDSERFFNAYIDEGFFYMDDERRSLRTGFNNLVFELDKEFTILYFRGYPGYNARENYCKPEIIESYRIKLQKWMNQQIRMVA